MRSLKAVSISSYFFLFLWWLIINLYNLEGTLGSMYFCLGLAYYFIFIPSWFVAEMVTKAFQNRLKLMVIFKSFGVFLFGLSFLSIYCSNIFNAYGYYCLIFYIFQFPFSLLGLIQLFKKGSSVVNMFLLTLFVTGLSLTLTSSMLDFHSFLIFYLPVKSLALVLVCIIVAFDNKKYSSLTLILIGYVFWFLGDISFVVSTLNKIDLHFYSYFLYLSAVFLVNLGTINYIIRKRHNFLEGGTGPVLFKSIPYQIPFSLNVFQKNQ